MSGLETSTILMLVSAGSTAAGAASTIRAGHLQSAMYGAQADQTRAQGRSQVLKARQEALQHREKGLQVLDQMRRTGATINARGSANAINPFAGSTGNLMTVNLKEGFEEFSTTKTNRLIAEDNMVIMQKSAERQASIYKIAGSQAKSSAYASAFMQIASSAAMMGMSGFGSAGSAAAAPGSLNTAGSYGAMGSGGSLPGFPKIASQPVAY